MSDFTLLIVDDDKEIRELLTKFLTDYGYAVLSAANGEQLFTMLNTHNIDLIILDIRLPGEDGFSLCQKMRRNSLIPIIMLTASGDQMDRIIGLEMGADDYLPKPFNPRELVARIKAVLRRSQENPAPLMVSTGFSQETYKFGGWYLETTTRRLLSPDEIEVSLTSGEYNLLITFLQRPRRVLSRDQLLEVTHNRPAGPYDRSIDIQVSRLRQKVEGNPKKPSLIKTVRGGGYMFTSAVERVLLNEQ